jgi:flagellar assembly factor FliW
MLIETTRFGRLDVEESKCIDFPWGIPAFENLKRFILLEHGEGPIHWLQAVDDPSVAFVVCPPEVPGVKYRLPPQEKKPLKLENDEDLLILNLVSSLPDRNLLRFHVRSPLLFNTLLRFAYQWSIDPEDIDRYLVLPEGTGLKPDVDNSSGPESFIYWTR